jgi:hypothetical protein
MGQHSFIKFFFLERENILRWASRLNGAVATAETWDLKGCMLKVKKHTYCRNQFISLNICYLPLVIKGYTFITSCVNLMLKLDM